MTLARASLHLIALLAICLATISPAQEAKAFCGFYVSGAGEEMFNNATMVVMMREGTKTVLSMRNNYEGPPEDFAMVIPVPQVLKEEDVKTLKDELFDRVDKLAAPRLVEYWEQNPCMPLRGIARMRPTKRSAKRSKSMSAEPASIDEDLGVTVEAEFDVGEYNVAILSAKESTGLETWLTANKYNIPEGAAPVLNPYVEQGMYFFVARVDPKKIEFSKDGQAQLSPLRFAYDSEDFSLPVRLGLLNAKGHQDLIVHILAKNTRYEVANYKNVSIPTNLIVKDSVREQFANFYVSLFDRVLEENPGSVVTEYAWSSGKCDPCPGPTLSASDIRTLGEDYLIAHKSSDLLPPPPPQLSKDRPTRPGRRTSRRRRMRRRGNPWTLTRLHARYTEKDLTEDLIFKKAEAITGGRGTPTGLGVLKGESMDGELPVPSTRQDTFQGRYIILHEWEGEIACARPVRGVWTGQAGQQRPPTGSALDTAFVKRDKAMLDASLITQTLQIQKSTGTPPQEPPPAEIKKEEALDTPEPAQEETKPKTESKPKSCAQAPLHNSTPSPWWLAALAIICGVRRRKEK